MSGDEEEEEKPKKKDDDEEEEEKPKKKVVDEEEEEKPKKKVSGDEEEEEKPKKKDDEEEKPTEKKEEKPTEEKEEEKPTPRGKDIIEQEYYRKVDAGHKITPDKEEEKEEEESNGPSSKPMKKQTSSKFISLNLLMMVAGILIMFAIIISVLCSSGRKRTQYVREVLLMSRRAEETTLLRNPSFNSPTERPLTQATLSSTEETVPIAVSIPSNPVENKEDSFFDDGDSFVPVVKSHRRSHTKRARQSKV